MEEFFNITTVVKRNGTNVRCLGAVLCQIFLVFVNVMMKKVKSVVGK